MIEIEIVEVLTPISIDVNQTNEVVDIVIEQTTETIAIEIVEGRDGTDGLSAYQIAVENGYVGTEDEWLLSLVGANGTNGINGTNGAKGDKGDKGDTGATGAKGDTGDSGILTFSTTGNSGASTYNSGTKALNVPIYSLAGLGGEPIITAGTIGQYFRGDKTWQTLDKSAVGLGNVDNTSDANKPISTATQTALNAKGNGTVTSVSALTIGTTGTDVTSTVATGTTTPVITLNIPTASASNRGALSSTDWSTFNSKIGGSGTSTQLAFFNAGSTITSDSLLVWDNTSKWLGIGMTPIMKLQVSSSASSPTLPVAQLLRPNGTNVNNKSIGYPYLLIGGAVETGTLNVMASIGFGYNYSNIYFPFVEIGSQTTSTSGNLKGDFWIATRPTTTNVAATERIRVLSSGETGFGTSSPNTAALVDITSTTKGFLPPRMTTTQKNAISSPPAGLQVYDSTLNKMCFYNGSAWETITSS